MCRFSVISEEADDAEKLPKLAGLLLDDRGCWSWKLGEEDVPTRKDTTAIVTARLLNHP